MHFTNISIRNVTKRGGNQLWISNSRHAVGIVIFFIIWVKIESPLILSEWRQFGTLIELNRMPCYLPYKCHILRIQIKIWLARKKVWEKWTIFNWKSEYALKDEDENNLLLLSIYDVNSLISVFAKKIHVNSSI